MSTLLAGAFMVTMIEMSLERIDGNLNCDRVLRIRLVAHGDLFTSIFTSPIASSPVPIR